MKRKILSLITAAGILLSLITVPQTAGAIDPKPLAASIKLGDYVEMGEYTGSPILWRCVAFEKISGYDADGNPITDSTQTVTEYQDGYLPLMLADTPICQKAFDAKGSDTSGSHGRDSYRTSRGSNYWGDSNIRDWLNSSASAGDVVWTCGNPPSSGNVEANPYDTETGFLTNFTDTERAAMKTVTQKSLLAECDKELNTVTDATGYHTYNDSIGDVVQNYSEAYAENITDTVFLLDVQQIYNVYKNDDSLGGNGYYKSALWDWLRSPYASDSCSARGVDLSGDVNYVYAYGYSLGVRPAFYLNLSSVIFTLGGGTDDNPYTDAAFPIADTTISVDDQTYTGNAIEPDVTVKDGDTPLVKGTDYEVTYSGDNVNVGRATVTITGIGNYTGTVTSTFNITPKPLAASIKLGDYVEMGEYNGSAIKWRCVAFERISGYDDNGNPITDSTDTVTEYQDGYLPLMLADSAICQKVFDAAGSNTSGSHSRSSDGYRTSYGSNYWGDSNIRDWLNSDSETVTYTCGNSPSYSGEAGFLTNFTDTERAAIETVTQKSLLVECDKDLNTVTDATGSHILAASIDNIVQNYSTAYAENITDTVFLLDVQQIYNVYTNDNSLGGSGYYKSASLDWLRSPGASFSCLVRGVYSTGNVYGGDAYRTCGVRPAFYLNLSSVIFASGEGTSGNPYELLDIPDQTYTGSEIEPDVTVTDGETTLGKGTDYEVTYSNNVNVGTAKVTITGINNYTGTVTTTFNITPKPLAASIKLGDYVEMGEYNGSAIKWRCVAFEKISGYDADGNPITDSTTTVTEYQDGYLPLMLADSAICQKEFDAAGSVTTGSHGRYSERTNSGSNYWGDSNIRDWLNSTASAGNVVWSCGNPPSYANEAGFLTNFTDSEKAAIKTVTQKCVLPDCDMGLATIKGTSTFTDIYAWIQNINTLYEQFYAYHVTDTIFLLDGQQIYNVYTNLQNYYFDNVYCWLRYPYNTSYGVRGVMNYEGRIFGSSANDSNYYVRPAFYLDPASVIFALGNGASENPYELLDIPDQTYTGSAITPEVTVKDGDNTLTADTDYTVTYENNINIGTSTVTITGINNYTGTITATFNVKADSKTDVATDPESAAVTYGDTLTLTAKVARNDAVSTLSVLSAEPDKVDFYVGETLLGTADVDYGEDTEHLSGTAELTVNTTDKKLSADGNTIKAEYGGSVNLNGSDSDSITVTVNKKPLEYSVTATDRVYDGTTAVDVALTPTNVESGDDVSLTADAVISSADVGKYETVNLSNITLSGDDADYYSVDATKTDVPLTSAVTISEKPLAASIKLGDYVEMGEYNGSAIKWRCVAFEKISGYDADGNPITDSTTTVTEYQDGYLPLMLADSAICQKAFDVAGSVTTGDSSHGRDSGRTSYGSNYWGDSNIRDWLNSTAGAGNVVWSCGNPPSYANEAGFLTNFTDSEKAAIKTVTQKSLLANCDAVEGIKVDGNAAHEYKTDISEVVANYADAYYENLTDTVFLLDVQQLYNVYKNDTDYWGNSGYYKAASGFDWLRSPYASNSSIVRYVNSGGNVLSYFAYYASGVRPAFYLNLSSVIFASGDGTSDNSYELLDIPDQTYTGGEIEPPVTVKDGNTTLEAGTDYEVSYSNNKNVGPATVTVTGKGNYTGTVTTTFNIVKAGSQTGVTTDPTNSTVTYGDTLTLTAEVSKKADTESMMTAFSVGVDTVEFYLNGSDEPIKTVTVDYGESNSDSGTATLKITADKSFAVGSNTIKAVYGGSVNLNGSENDSITVTLEKKPLEYSVTAADRVYDGTTTVDVTLAPTNAEDNDDVTLTATGYISSANVGSYTAVDLSDISVSGDDADYYSVDETKTDVPLTSAVTISQKPLAASIKLGDYVEMGTYDTDGDGTAEPILWRCVAFEKISGYDDSGNPITDSTTTVTEYQDGYLPLMLADSAICEKAFDAQGNVTSGSHSRGHNRTGYGSNYWGDSNIRDWLNSSASAGDVVWSCGNSPSYSGEAGFLTNFKDAEKAAIKTVTQKSLLADCDAIEGIKVGGSEPHEYKADISEVVANYVDAYYENITDTVFLLDVQQLYNVYKNDAALGGEHYKAASWDWLRSSSNSYDDIYVRYVNSSGYVNNYYAYCTFGVRPAFYLNLSSVIFTSGDGTSDSPYEEPTDGVPVIFDDIPDQTYTGNAIEPDVTVTGIGTTLEKDKDYEVTYSGDNVNVGTATVTISGIGNYTGTVTTAFNIVKAESQTTAENQTVTYGDTLTLTANVAKSGSSSTLSAFSAAENTVAFYLNGSDEPIKTVTVDYGTSNSDSGTATLKITAGKDFVIGSNTVKAVYGGSVNLNDSENDSITVTLEKKPLEYSVASADRVYDGTTTVDVTLTPTNKIDGDDVSLTATGNISSKNVGSYTAVELSDISVSGDDADYYSVESAKENVELTSAVTISEKSINDASITVENISNKTYTGNSIEPDVTVKDGDTPLTENTDYTVSYSNNTNVGKATITITGKGNYNETKALEFEIVKAGSQTTAENQIVTYGDTLTLTASVSKQLTVLSSLSLFTVDADKVAFYVGDNELGTADVKYTDTTAKDKGTATLEITAGKNFAIGPNTIKAVYGGSVNLNGSEKDNITVTLEKKEVGLTWSGYDNLVFDGNEKSVTAAVVAADIEDGDNVTVTVTDGDATNAGIYTATATLTGTDAGYYTLANGTQTYTIEKATPTDYTIPTGLTATYGQNLSDIELPSGFAWSDATVSVGNAGTNTFTVTYTPSDTTNYKTVDGISVTVGVAKATPEYTVPTGLTAVIGKTLESVTLPDGWSWSDSTASVGAIGENEFTAVFTPSDTDNYNIVTETLIITVEYATTETELKRGDSVIREDETVEYNEDNTITIDKSNDGTTDVTITVPDNTETVTVDENGDVAVPENGTVKVGDNEQITLPDGGSVDGDGNVTGNPIKVGDTTITAPDGETVTVDEDGNVTVPENGTVKVGDNEEITLPDGGTVDKDGNTSGETVVIGDTTITAPEGENVTVDENGDVAVPENGTVKVGDNEEITLPDGGSVDGDGNVTGNPIKVGDTTITAPDGETVTVDKDGNTKVTAGDTVETDDVKITVDEGNGIVDKGGNISFPEGGTVTIEQDGTTTTVDVEAGGTINPSSLPTPTPTVKRSSGGGTSSRKVTFDAGEHGEITSGKSSVSVTYNSKVKETDIPTVTAKEGYVFLGWSVDGENETDVTTVAIKKAMTFTALYEAAPKTEPQQTAEPSVTDKPALSGENPFTDVSDSDWFFDSVISACKDGLMVGVSDTEFAPYMNITRGMFVTVLYRMEGEPETAFDYTFEDIATDAYYANAVAWGSANGIIQGYSAAQYAPDDSITREQMAAIIYRYAKFKGYDVSVNGGVNYADRADISDYALDAVIWSGENGIMLGNADNTFAPQNNATRAEAAAVFERVYGFIK